MDAIIFDFDGVVVDSEPIHMLGFVRVLKTLGIELTRADYYSRYLGFDDHDCFAAVMRDHQRVVSEEQIADWETEKTRIVQDIMRQMIQPLPGSVELIRAAAEAGIPLAICSGALMEEIELASKTIGIRDCFPVIVAAKDVTCGKPDPEGYVKAARLLSEQLGKPIQPQRCCVCEDSPAGIAAAKGAGMKVCAVSTSYAPEELTAADHIAKDLSEVNLPILRELARK